MTILKNISMGMINQTPTKGFHPHPDLLPSREKESKSVIARNEVTWQSLPVHLYFFSLRNQFTDTISQVPTQNKKMKSSLVHISFIFLPLTPSLFEGVRISSFHLFPESQFHKPILIQESSLDLQECTQ